MITLIADKLLMVVEIERTYVAFLGLEKKSYAKLEQQLYIG